MERVKVLLAAFAVAATVCSSTFAAEPLRLGIVARHDEHLGDYDTLERFRALGRALSAKLKTPVQLSTIGEPFTAVKRVSRGEYDLVLAPAHVIAAALKANYHPVAQTVEKTGSAFVVGAGAKARDLAETGRVRLGVPASDSLQYGLARVEFNRRAIEPRKRFSEVHHYRDQDVALYGIEIGAIDVAVADAAKARDWVKVHGGRILQTTAEVPVLGMAVNLARLSADVGDKVLAVLREQPVGRHAGKPLRFVGGQREEYAALASSLNATPTELRGARLIDAREARQLKDKGVLIVDARNAEEFAAGRIPGAVFVPYGEVSAKEVGFDASEDSFDLDKLPADRSATVILYCDGTPCWKSYKAATVAIARGYRNILWFRGGYPEWKAAGLPIETGERRN